MEMAHGQGRRRKRRREVRKQEFFRRNPAFSPRRPPSVKFSDQRFWLCRNTGHGKPGDCQTHPG